MIRRRSLQTGNAGLFARRAAVRQKSKTPRVWPVAGKSKNAGLLASRRQKAKTPASWPARWQRG